MRELTESAGIPKRIAEVQVRHCTAVLTLGDRARGVVPPPSSPDQVKAAEGQSAVDVVKGQLSEHLGSLVLWEFQRRWLDRPHDTERAFEAQVDPVSFLDKTSATSRLLVIDRYGVARLVHEQLRSAVDAYAEASARGAEIALRATVTEKLNGSDGDRVQRRLFTAWGQRFVAADRLVMSALDLLLSEGAIDSNQRRELESTYFLSLAPTIAHKFWLEAEAGDCLHALQQEGLLDGPSYRSVAEQLEATMCGLATRREALIRLGATVRQLAGGPGWPAARTRLIDGMVEFDAFYAGSKQQFLAALPSGWESVAAKHARPDPKSGHLHPGTEQRGTERYRAKESCLDELARRRRELKQQ